MTCYKKVVLSVACLKTGSAKLLLILRPLMRQNL